MKKITSFLKRHSKQIVISMAIACMSALSALSAFAEETDIVSTSSIKDSFSSALSTIQTDILGYIALVIPVALLIFGTVVAIKKGISFVKSLIGR